MTRRAAVALALSYAGIALAVWHDIRHHRRRRARSRSAARSCSASALGYAIYLVAAGGIIARLGSSRFIAWAMLASAAFIVVQFALTHPLSALHVPLDGPRADARDGGVLHGAADVDDRRIGPPHRREHGVADRLARPVFTIGFGALLLGEPVNALQIVGMALVLAGVMLVSRGARRIRRVAAA